MGKVFKVDAAVQVTGFHTFSLGKWSDVTMFSGYTMEGRMVTSLHFGATLFTGHPSEVGSTTPWTVLAAMLRPCFAIFVAESHISTISKFVSSFFCARRINVVRESLFQKLAQRNNATPPFL